MPGTRAMAEALALNRQTVVRAYDELYSQGWLELRQSQGTFVSESLPEVKPVRLEPEKNIVAGKSGFHLSVNTEIHAPAKPNRHMTGFHDGPDVRLVPADLLSRGYRRVLGRATGRLLLSYIDIEGTDYVRQAIATYLNESRGLQAAMENILITRGTQMAMYLLAQVLLEKGDAVITASVGFRYAELTFLHAGARLVKVPVDEEGLDVDAVEQECRKGKIRALYVTSHHHYPTTVTMSAPRRMKLLRLAEEFRFVIIEDDYDYEFHYESSPILPLASADHQGLVIYIGSFSKTVTPAIRMGYVVAPPDLILELAKLRMLVDAQGESVMEQVIAELLNEGEIRRHMKKSLKVYQERRNFLCNRLREEMGDAVNFRIPQGGLAIWAEFDKGIAVPELSRRMHEKGVAMSPGKLHDISAGRPLNSARLGFGWMNEEETERAIRLMAKIARNR